jgi:hypothetical protein
MIKNIICLFGSVIMLTACGGGEGDGADGEEDGTNVVEEVKVDLQVVRKELEAAIKACDTNTLAALIKEHEDIDLINSINKKNQPLIHFAVMTDCMDAVKFLVSQKVKMDTTDMIDRYPIHCAASHSTLDMIKYLVSLGADINHVTEKKQSVRDYARGNFFNSAYDQRKLIEQWLTDQGVKR